MQSQLGQELAIEHKSSCVLSKNTITKLHPQHPQQMLSDISLTRLTAALPPFTGDYYHTWTSHVFFDLLNLCTQPGTWWYFTIRIPLSWRNYFHICQVSIQLPSILEKSQHEEPEKERSLEVLGEDAGTGGQCETLSPVPWGPQAQSPTKYTVHWLFSKEVKFQLTSYFTTHGFLLLWAMASLSSNRAEAHLLTHCLVKKQRLTVVKKSPTARDLFQRWRLDFDLPVPFCPTQTRFSSPLSVQWKSMKTCNTQSKAKQSKNQ